MQLVLPWGFKGAEPPWYRGKYPLGERRIFVLGDRRKKQGLACDPVWWSSSIFIAFIIVVSAASIVT